MKEAWREYEREEWKDNFETDKYKPMTLAEAYGGSNKFERAFGEMRWLKQLAGAVALFLLTVGLLSWDNPKAITLQQGLKYLLVEEKSDFTPTLEALVREGIWLDPYERQVYQENAGSSESAQQPVMSIPVSGKFARNYGWVQSSITGTKTFHEGIDIETEAGAPVRAALDGQVITVDETQSLGRVIEIQHQNGLSTVYGTMGEILVQVGQSVRQGEIIGKTGKIKSTGKGQLHFEVRENGKAIDPLEKITNVRTSI